MRKRREHKRRVREEQLQTALKDVGVYFAKQKLHNIAVEENDGEIKSIKEVEPSPVINWDGVPQALDPFSDLTKLTKKGRAKRKRQQLESMVRLIRPVFKRGDTFVDFGCGSGHLGLLLSCLFPSSRVILVDNNLEKLAMAKRRMANMLSHGCVNIFERVECVSDIDLLKGRSFDVGVGLHCCGPLSDKVLECCREARANFVLSPCCYGKIRKELDQNFGYQENFGQGELLAAWEAIAQAADFQCGAADDFDPTGPSFRRAKMCMNYVDAGLRLHALSGPASPYNYAVSLRSMVPLSCSPKNNVVVGILNIRENMGTFVPLAKEMSGCSKEAECISFESKVIQIKAQFSKIVKESVIDAITLVETPTPFYRLRCRFGLCRNGESEEEGYTHFVYGKGKWQKVKSFPIASQSIALMMPRFLKALKDSAPIIRDGIEAVHYLSTLKGDMCITLVYSIPIASNGTWESEAKQFKSALERASFLPIKLIGRSKKVCIYVGDSSENSKYVKESLCLRDGSTVQYLQCENSFSNPNGRVNEKVLDWLTAQITSISSATANRNLLELYCGNGNHTMALAKYFNSLCAVELDKELCKVAKRNCDLNGIKNVRIVQIHSEHFWKKFTSVVGDGVIQFDGASYDTVLVDPPRAGLDGKTIEQIAAFGVILYISCMPSSLQRDLEILNHTHECTAMGMFDQFAFTQHIECGVVLRKKEGMQR